MGFFSLHVYMNTTCMPGACGGTSLGLYFLLLAVIQMSKRPPSLLNLLPRSLRARAQPLTSLLPSVLPPWTQPFLLQGPLDGHLGLAMVLPVCGLELTEVPSNTMISSGQVAGHCVAGLRLARMALAAQLSLAWVTQANSCG